MRYHLLHVGVGNVGGTVMKQIFAEGSRLTQELGIQLVYCGLFTDSAGVFEPEGLSDEQIKALPSNAPLDIGRCIDLVPAPFILIDTTASDATLPLMQQALVRGGAVVMSNKKPLASDGKAFDALHKLGGERLFYETTVGAGLPVIRTLKTLLATGDEVVQLQGCFSGTLGFIFSQLEAGSLFSEAVLEAKKRGYTEPDPREDLAGTDVARKALIVARLLGRKLELADIKAQALYPASMQKLSKEAFLDTVTELDKDFAQKVEEAKQKGQVLRYVATIDAKSCRVGLEAVDKNSDIGALHGPDNIIVFTTKRYAETPLVVKGPGAGLEVTAGGVFGDVLDAARVLQAQSIAAASTLVSEPVAGLHPHPKKPAKGHA